MTYTIKLNSLARSGFFRRLPIPSDTPYYGEILLGRKILDKALLDYFSKSPSILDETQTMKQEVSAWIGSEDFISICQLAVMPDEKVSFIFSNIRKVVIDDC